MKNKNIPDKILTRRKGSRIDFFYNYPKEWHIRTTLDLGGLNSLVWGLSIIVREEIVGKLHEK